MKSETRENVDIQALEAQADDDAAAIAQLENALARASDTQERELIEAFLDIRRGFRRVSSGLAEGLKGVARELVPSR